MTTYLSRTALDQIDQAQAELERHLFDRAGRTMHRMPANRTVREPGSGAGRVRTVRATAGTQAGGDLGGPTADGGGRSLHPA
jgi:hypothetical protein